MEGLLSAMIGVAFHGVAYGMILYVIGIGLSITMGLMNFANLAHGAFAMMGGYILVSATNRFGIPFPIALIIAFVVVAAFSAILEKLIFSRLYNSSDLEQVLFTLGLLYVSVAVARMIYGTAQQPIYLPDYFNFQFQWLGREFPAYRTFIIAAGATIAAILWFGLERTRWGAMVRAAVDNRVVAQSIGINTSRLFTATFALGSGLAALGGALGADFVAIRPTYGLETLINILVVVAIGGMGSLRGTFFAALAIGIADTAFRYWLPDFGSFFIYAALFPILLWRPSGFFGRQS